MLARRRIGLRRRTGRPRRVGAPAGKWEHLPESRRVDDGYYAKILPALDRELGLAGLRPARFLNDVQAPGRCAAR